MENVLFFFFTTVIIHKVSCGYFSSFKMFLKRLYYILYAIICLNPSNLKRSIQFSPVS